MIEKNSHHEGDKEIVHSTLLKEKTITLAHLDN